MRNYIKMILDNELDDREISVNASDLDGMLENVMTEIIEAVNLEDITEREVDRYIEATEE